MRKLFVVFRREYLQTARKKSFVIMTILFPFLMGGLMIVPGILATKSLAAKRVAVLDGTGRLREALQPRKLAESLKEEISRQAPGFASRTGPMPGLVSVEYVRAAGDLTVSARPYLDRMSDASVAKERRLDGVLLIPDDALENPRAKLTYYSRSSTDLIGEREIARVVNQAAARQRLADHGMDPDVVDKALRGLPVESLQVSRSGQAKSASRWNFLVGIVFTMLLFIPTLIYGIEIMRGIVQEKTDRIMEILISSLSPMQLLAGKVLGLAAVGLTQVAAWMVMGGLAMAGAGGMAAAAGFDMGQFLRWSIVPYFLIFYILGYMIYVCIYAVGGAITNSEKEAQAATMPAMLIVMTPWFLLAPIIFNPDSRLATVLSLIPFFSPITMFIRVLVSTPPFWQIGLSIVLTSATIYFMFWVAAKIFRVGILSYGKRPTIPELWRWLKVA
jgi:ABC-2 type transport system permease protein